MLDDKFLARALLQSFALSAVLGGRLLFQVLSLVRLLGLQWCLVLLFVQEVLLLIGCCSRWLHDVKAPQQKKQGGPLNTKHLCYHTTCYFWGIYFFGG